MNHERSPQFASYAEPEVTDARIARQWSAIEQRLPTAVSAPSRWLRVVMFGAPLAAAFALLLLWLFPRTVPGADSLVESAESPIALRLHDGSSVELDAHTRLRVVREQPDAVEVSLAGGSARFDVTHVAGRRFDVSLGAALVTVVGTRFEVARLQRPEGTLVRVNVTRGVVEVRRRDQPGGVRRLSEGETWSALLPSSPSSLVEAPAAGPQPSAATEAVTVPAPTAAAPAQGDAAELDEQDGENGVSDGLVDDPPNSPRQGAAARARAVFQRANVARRAGQMQEAADAYVELLRRHRHDPRAGLSSFELGRIRMDAFGDPKGAVQAFSVALALSPSASFREDALARIVVAYDAMGRRSECKKARDRYLGAYSQGVHVASLAARCD